MAKKLRCAFECVGITAGSWREVFLHAVTDQKDWTQFTKHTPAGNISIHIDHDSEAASFFEEGRSYFVDFTESKECQEPM